jgi:ABC-2 type transport system ATP-binding protein
MATERNRFPAGIILLDNVSKQLRGRPILKQVSFNVQAGDIFGYLGPNGAGKTTTIRILLGLLAPDSGKASLQGWPASQESARKTLGFMLEADGLYENLSALENLAYYAALYEMPPENTEIRIAKTLKMVALTARAEDKVGNYSKGMRQRLALARAVMHDPSVLVLDEPTSGIDPTGQIEIREIILEMAHREGKTIFLSSHNLDEVQRICNRIALIDRGEIKLCGELDSLQRQMGLGEAVIETTTMIPTAVLNELKTLPYVTVKDQNNNRLTLAISPQGSIPEVVFFLAGRQVGIEQVRRSLASLEEIYTSILKEAEIR